MKVGAIPLRRTCRQAAALLIAREDRTLGLSDTLALRLHLLACKKCPQFENQILTMRLAMDRWRRYTQEAESPTQIRADE
jgi:hypothetical protein